MAARSSSFWNRELWSFTSSYSVHNVSEAQWWTQATFMEERSGGPSHTPARITARPHSLPRLARPLPFTPNLPS